MITVKNIFLATVLITGSLAFWGNVGAYYKDKAGNICPVKGDKMQVCNVFPGEGSWDLQVSEEGRLKFERGYENEQDVFTVKEIVTLHLPDGKPAESFKLETCNKKELKLIKGSNGYVIEESSEKNKSNAQDVCFKFSAYGENQNIRCFPDGKIEKITKTIDGKETEKIMQYGICIGGSSYDDDRGDAVVSGGWGGSGNDFIITFLTPETSAPQEKSTVLEVKKAAPENIIKEENTQLEEMTRKFEEQLEINRKLQEELNNLKAGKSSDTVTIEKESKPVVSSKQSQPSKQVQPSRVSAPRQGARGRAQTQRK